MPVEAPASAGLAMCRDQLSPEGGLLLKASRKGEVGVMAELLEAGAPLEVMGTNKSTPLILAASECHTAAVRTLLAAGAAVDAADADGSTALALAAGTTAKFVPLPNVTSWYKICISCV